MCKRQLITLEEVGAIVEMLYANGEKVTVRNIQRLTGGSLSTIFTLKTLWMTKMGG